MARKKTVVGAKDKFKLVSLSESPFEERDYDLLDEAQQLFKDGGIRIASNENFHEAILNSSGHVVGASVVGLTYDEMGTTVRFSVAVSKPFRRQGIARRLIKSIIAEYEDDCEIEAWVVNPIMVDLLNDLGFNEPHGGWSQDNPFFTRRAQ
jgi:GNAT superfamily N-acetyltransferase